MGNNLDQIAWGIIGCGDVTEVKSGPALRNVEHSRVASVMRRNGELAADYARRHGIDHWTDNSNELIDHPDVNAIYIATPPASHRYYCLKAAAAGKPVYVEKPMAISYEECEEMVQACAAENVALYVAYYRRSLPKYLEVKQFLESGHLGEIQSVTIRLHQPASNADKEGSDNWRVNPRIAGAGYFFDLGSHIFDLLQYFLGPIVKANGVASNLGGFYEAEDQVSCSFQFESGVTGSGNFNFNADKLRDETTIIGTSGTIVYPHFNEDEVIVETAGKIETLSTPNPVHIQQPLIQTIIDELRGLGECPSKGESAIRTSWVLDRILGRIGP